MTLIAKRSKVSHIHVTTPPESHISPLLCSTASRFRATGNFETSVSNDPKMTLNTKRYPMSTWQLPSSPKYQAVLLYGQAFSSCSHFETSASTDPQLTLNAQKSKVPQIHMITTPESQFSKNLYWFRSTETCLWVTGHFEISALNDPQMTLNAIWSKASHICYKSLRVPPNFTRFCSTASCFWVIGQFETSGSNDPKMTLNTKRSKVPHIVVAAVVIYWQKLYVTHGIIHL